MYVYKLIKYVRGFEQVIRPPKDDIDMINSRARRRDVIYSHPMIPGYQGIIFIYFISMFIYLALSTSEILRKLNNDHS